METRDSETPGFNSDEFGAALTGAWPALEGLRLEQHLANILEHSTDGIAIVDDEGLIRLWSPSAERMFGYSADEILGHSVEILVPPHLLESGELFRIEQSARTRGSLRRYRTTRVAKGGALKNIELTVAALHGQDGTYMGRSCIFRDLTDSSRLEAQMRQSQRLSTVAQLVAGLAHEIGTPLNVIAGRAELLMMDLKPQDPARRDLQVIMNESERVADLVRTLLQFARGDSRVRLRRCSLNGIVKEAIKLVGRQSEVARIKIETDLAPRLPLFSANRNQVLEIALNLVVNSWHAMPEGGRLSFRTASVFRDNCVWVELRVSDTGTGIPPEIGGKIFKPFFSTKEASVGTGLGLSVVDTIVKHHGGRIRFTSEPGQGTTFIVSFPVERGEGTTR
jgi:PAS domain S-box-containing protein